MPGRQLGELAEAAGEAEAGDGPAAEVLEDAAGEVATLIARRGGTTPSTP
jgi:hypothetical protein